MIKAIVSVAALASLVSCAHHRDVRPASDGLHSVQVRTETKEEGARNALSQAKHFCEQRGKYAVIEKEHAEFNHSSMSEAEYNRAKTAAKVTKGVGSAAYVFGGTKESQLGGIAALGGSIADGAIGAGYVVSMKFRCQ
jgi:hypothetical protein